MLHVCIGKQSISAPATTHSALWKLMLCICSDGVAVYLCRGRVRDVPAVQMYYRSAQWLTGQAVDGISKSNTKVFNLACGFLRFLLFEIRIILLTIRNECARMFACVQKCIEHMPIGCVVFSKHYLAFAQHVVTWIGVVFLCAFVLLWFACANNKLSDALSSGANSVRWREIEREPEVMQNVVQHIYVYSRVTWLARTHVSRTLCIPIKTNTMRFEVTHILTYVYTNTICNSYVKSYTHARRFSGRRFRLCSGDQSPYMLYMWLYSIWYICTYNRENKTNTNRHLKFETAHTKRRQRLRLPECNLDGLRMRVSWLFQGFQGSAKVARSMFFYSQFVFWPTTKCRHKQHTKLWDATRIS